MPIDTLHKARQAVARSDSAAVSSALAFDAGDAWQLGKGWAGPAPDLGDAERSSVMQEIERGFVSKNIIGEIVDRHIAGVLGREPQITIQPRRAVDEANPVTADEAALIAEAEGLITGWLDDRRALRTLQTVTRFALIGGQACLRAYVPSGLLVDGAVEAATPADALGVVYLDALNPLSAAVVTDPKTKRQTGVVVYTDPDTRRQAAEVSEVLPNGLTAIRVLTMSGETERVELDLGGRLPVFAVDPSRIVSPQVIQLQKLMNLALTMMSRNVVLGGFLERVILNAQLPGRWVDQPDGSKQFERDPFAVGAGTTNVLAGLPTYDDDGNVNGYTNPSVMYRDPVSVQSFTDTATAAYHGILEEVAQTHALLSGDATASGESRRQAVADFRGSLGPTKAAVDGAGRWLVETLLGFVGAFTGKTGRYAGLRANFATRIDTGPLPTPELDLIVRQVEALILSRETGMERIGVEDTDAEKSRIDEEQQADEERRARVFNAGLLPSLTPEGE